MFADERLELGDELAIAAQQAVGLEPPLERQQPELLESPHLVLRERLVREVGERRSAPERKRLAQEARRAGWRRVVRCLDELLESQEVELVRPRLDHVAGLAGDDRRSGPERLAQLRDVVLERVRCRSRRILVPQQVDQPIPGHDLVRARQEEREERALARAAEGDRATLLEHLERAEDPELPRSARASTLALRPAQSHLSAASARVATLAELGLEVNQAYRSTRGDSVSVDTKGGDGAEVFGYRTEAVIGRGGMGVVYRAQDVRLRRTVALKVMAPELARDERFRERFMRETELAMSLEHPNVVPIHDAGEADGHLYLVMRCVEGTDLRALLRAEGALAPGRTLAIIRQVAGALDAAHARGLVHRDVKPSNVLLDANEHVYLADFGLTRRLSEEGPKLGESASLGTPAYLAPEQIEGRPVGARADVYALGCLLFECLTGEPPFSGVSRLAVAWAHLEEDPPSASERNPQLPQAIDPVVRKAMAKEPDERHATCAELVGAAALGLGRRANWRRRTLVLAATVTVFATLAAAFVARADDDAVSLSGIGPNKLIRVDPATNSVAATIDVGTFPSGVAIGGGSVWVYNLADHTVSEIEARTNEVVQTTRVSTVPTDVGAGAGPVLAADAEGVWVIGRVGNESVLTRIGSDGRGTREHRLEGELKAIAVGEGAVWILGHRGRSDSIIRVDPRSGVVTRRTRMPDGFAGSAVSAAARRASSGRLDGLAVGGGSVWAAATQAGTLYRVDPTTGAVRLRDLGGVTLRPVFGFGRVWMCVDGTMQRINPRTLRDSRSGTGLGGEREYVPGYGSMWRHDGASGTLMRFDPQTGDVAGLTPLPGLNRHEGAVTSIAAGAGGVWLTVARSY